MSLSFNPPIIAHRGLSAKAPENTFAAFELAKEQGLQWIEFDVMLAKCGTPIIFHDEVLDRTTNQTGPVDRYTVDELEQFDAGSWFSDIYAGEPIPTFKAVLDWLLTNEMCANVEIKPLPGQDIETASAIVEMLATYHTPLHERLLLSSFSLSAMLYCKLHAATWYRGLLLHEWVDAWQAHVAECDVVSVHVNEAILTPNTIRDIKSLNKLLLSYTVNDPDRAKALFKQGVDAVFSDGVGSVLALID